MGISFVPTPSATDYGSNQGGAAGRTGKVRPSLKTILTPTAKGNMHHESMKKWAGNWAFLATPTARDWRSGKASDATHDRNSRPLNEQLERAALSGTAVLLAVSEWLLGYPPGWLARASALTAIPWSRKSPKQSGERS
jgi:hypothetical protein